MSDGEPLPSDAEVDADIARAEDDADRRTHEEAQHLPGSPEWLIDGIKTALAEADDQARIDRDEALEALADVVNQACYSDKDRPELDSMAISAYADGMRVLAKHGRFQITHEVGRRVCGRLVEP